MSTLFETILPFNFLPHFNTIYYNTFSYSNPLEDDYAKFKDSDVIIALFISFFIWFAFSLLYPLFSSGNGLLKYTVLALFLLSTLNSLLSHQLTDKLISVLYTTSRVFSRGKNRIFYFLRRGFRRVSTGLVLLIDRGIEDLLKLISETFTLLFLVLILFIFFLITKCTDDSRSLVVFLFKDFLVLSILLSLFLIYSNQLAFDSFKWVPYNMWNLLLSLFYFN